MQFSKHGTCTSTFDVACYAKYQEHEEVINFFETAVRYVILPRSDRCSLIVLQRVSTIPHLRLAGRLRHYSLKPDYLPVDQDPGCSQGSDRRYSVPRMQQRWKIPL